MMFCSYQNHHKHILIMNSPELLVRSCIIVSTVGKQITIIPMLIVKASSVLRRSSYREEISPYRQEICLKSRCLFELLLLSRLEEHSSNCIRALITTNCTRELLSRSDVCIVLCLCRSVMQKFSHVSL